MTRAMSGHGAHADPSNPFQKRVAITMAIYAVGLAFTNAAVNSSRSKSLLDANDAASKWAYYQAKGTKAMLRRLEVSLLDRLATGDAKKVEGAEEEIAKYEAEKAEIQAEARKLEAEQEMFEHREHRMEYGAIGFELAIVLAGVALLQASKMLYGASVASAIAAVGIVVSAFLAH